MCLNYTNFFQTNDVRNILISILTGILVTLIVILTQMILKKIKYRNLYKKFEGKYKGFRKYDYVTPDKPETIMELELQRKNNKFTIKNGKSLKNIAFPDIEGGILMDETLHNFGRGFYRHLKVPGFGYYEVQLQSDGNECKVLINSSFLDVNNNDIHKGQVWIKC